MTKRLVAFLLCVLLLVPAVALPAFSVEQEDVQKETFADGDYIVIETADNEPHIGYIADDGNYYSPQGYGDAVEEATLLSVRSILDLFRRIVRFITGTKTVEKVKYVKYYDTSGNIIWIVTLKAKFSYSETRVKCDSSKLTFQRRDPDWKMISSNATKSGNTARGEFIVRQTKLGVNLKTVEKTITLTCDKNGNVQ